MKRRHILFCPACHTRLLSVGCSVHDDADTPIAEWWLCPDCRGYYRVDGVTREIVPRATWAQELAQGISELCERSPWSESYKAAEAAKER